VKPSLEVGTATATKENPMSNQSPPTDTSPSGALATLAGLKTVLLTTYRRDGSPVATPVSLATDGEHAYVRTYEKAGKVRRLARNRHVEIAPSTSRGTPTGPAVKAVARRLSGDEARTAAHALARRHPVLQGVLVPFGHRVFRSRFGPTVHYALEAEAPVSPPSAG
jgi:PPOX class probable F420-dependent enzyme